MSESTQEKAHRLLGPLNAFDVYPELSEEIDRRILHSETRIKYWVLGGVLANVATFALTAIPSVFYLGQLSTNLENATTLLSVQVQELQRIKEQQERRNSWEVAAEQWMIGQGFQPPRTR